ncbi:SDR family oxidoreductase [Rhodobacterales bacterium]|nr:SDR family oxidoreductase [Rhodobacterales bacterium]
MIAVTGANGQLGRLVLKHLANRTEVAIRALVRSPENAQDIATARISVERADYDDPASLPTALEGVDRLLLISGSEVGKRVPQHKAVIDAAVAAGVSFIAYTSILNLPTSSLLLAKEHAATEKLIEDSGLPYIFLRNGWYLENFSGTIAGALAQGAVAGASGDGRFAAAPRDDYAEAAAAVLTSGEHTSHALELGGHPAFSLADLAAELSRQTGKDIPFVNLPEETYTGVLVQAGLPEAFAQILADSDRGAADGELETSSHDLKTLIGRPTGTLSEFVTRTL